MRELSRPMVLVVDDDPAILMSLDRGLGRCGYRVRLARSGDDALEVLDEEMPDLVLLDINMPGGQDGYEVCGAMRAQEGMEYVPIVFVTAMDTEHDEAKAFASGGTAFLRKPFELQELLHEVEEQIGTRKTWEEATNTLGHWSDWVAPESFARFKAYLAKERQTLSAADDTVAKLPGAQVYKLASLMNLPEEQIARHIGQFLDLPFLSTISADDLVLGVLPTAFCEKNLVVPIRDGNDGLAVVLCNPFNWELLDALNHSLWRDGSPKVSVAAPDIIHQIFEDPHDGLMHVPASREDDESGPIGEHVLRVANELLRAAVGERASDVRCFCPLDSAFGRWVST